MNRKVSAEHIIKQIRPCSVQLTSFNKVVENQVREQRLTYADTIQELCANKITDEQKAYMLDDDDDDDYGWCESPKKLITDRRSEPSRRPTRLSKRPSDYALQETKVREHFS